VEQTALVERSGARLASADARLLPVLADAGDGVTMRLTLRL
jgi:hypothetical protein